MATTHADALIDLINHVQFAGNEWQEMMDDLRYDGFDPSEMGVRIMSIPGYLPHLKNLLGFYLSRGTAINKGLSKTGQAGVKRLNDAVQALGIVSKITGKESITMNRLAACFPHIIALLMKTKKLQPKIGEVTGNVSPWFCFPAAPSIMPSTVWNDQRDSWLDWAVSFDKVIRPGTETDEDRKKKSASYAEISHGSSLFSATYRVTIMTTIG